MRWGSAPARRVLAALLRKGWSIKRQSGSHRVLSKAGSSNFVFAFTIERKSARGCWHGSHGTRGCGPRICSLNPVPVTLSGARVRLEPLDLERHFAGLCSIGLDPDLWRWTLNVCATPQQLRDYLETALREQREGRSLPFAIVDLATDRVAGCTRFGNIESGHRRVEIGWTWVGREFQRTHVNTEAKYLMMTHAFETWGCVRVELKTNALNRRSRDAMLRLGCVEEGVLRSHAISDGGVVRDTVYYSVLDREWLAVKARLEAMKRGPRE